MELPTRATINRAIPSILKSCQLFGISLIFSRLGNPESAKILSDFLDLPKNTGTDFIGDLSSVGLEVTAGELGENLKKVSEVFKSNELHDVEAAMTDAIRTSMPELRAELIRHYRYKRYNDDTLKVIGELFDKLENIQFKSLSITEKDLYNFVNSNYLLFKGIMSNPYIEWEKFYKNSDLVPSDFEAAISSSFAIIVTKKFHKIIIKGENRKILLEYSVQVLEDISRISKSNQERLILLEGLLEKLFPYLVSNQMKLGSIIETLRSIHIDLKRKGNSIERRLEEIQLLAQDKEQPMLYVPISTYNQAGKAFDYSYKSQYTSFEGRNEEKGKLWSFFYHNNIFHDFIWWILIGDGGIGKSRLAFEFCLDLRNSGKYAGFINNFEGFNSWETWQPKKPTFIVIDYASIYIDNVVIMIETMQRRSQSGRKLKFPVRLLLIERNNLSYWYEKLTNSQEIMSCVYLENPLQIEKLSLIEITCILDEIHKKNNKTNKFNNALLVEKIVLYFVKNIDKKGRPLFVFFYGMALVNGIDVLKWNTDQLLNYITREKKRIWQRKAKSDEEIRKHENLLYLCTICGGLELNILKDVLQRQYLYLPDIQNFDIDLFKIMTDVQELPNGKIFINPYLPDILGEFYVINRVKFLSESINFKDEAIVEELVLKSWELKSYMTSFFVFRLLNDFSDNESEIQKFYLINLSNLQDEDKTNWSRLLFELIFYYNKQKNIIKSEVIYSLSKETLGKYPIEGVLLSHAICAYNLIVGYRDVGGPNYLEKALDVYSELDKITDSTNYQIAIRNFRSCENILQFISFSIDNTNANFLFTKAFSFYKNCKRLYSIYNEPYTLSKLISCYNTFCYISLNFIIVDVIKYELELQFLITESKKHTNSFLVIDKLDMLISEFINLVAKLEIEIEKRREIIQNYINLLKDIFKEFPDLKSLTLDTAFCLLALDNAGIKVEGINPMPYD